MSGGRLSQSIALGWVLAKSSVGSQKYKKFVESYQRNCLFLLVSLVN